MSESENTQYRCETFLTPVSEKWNTETMHVNTKKTSKNMTATTALAKIETTHLIVAKGPQRPFLKERYVSSVERRKYSMH